MSAAGWGPRRASARRGTVSTDPGSARGTVPTEAPPMHCHCGHLTASHDISKTTKARTACSHMDDKGQCPCNRWEPPQEETT